MNKDVELLSTPKDVYCALTAGYAILSVYFDDFVRADVLSRED